MKDKIKGCFNCGRCNEGWVDDVDDKITECNFNCLVKGIVKFEEGVNCEIWIDEMELL